jgi:hypothetical protein
MVERRPTLHTSAILTFMLAFASLAEAQATRTWVSGVGDDVNPCSRTAPCKTFAGAISKTAVNGEIDVLDPGGFGAVHHQVHHDRRHRHIRLDRCQRDDGDYDQHHRDCRSGPPRHRAPSRPVDQWIRGGTHSGFIGINVRAGSTRPVKLFVDHVWVHGFKNEGLFFGGPGGDLSVKDSSFFDNGGAGIRVLSAATGQAGIVHVTVDRTHTDLNQQGVRFEDNGFGVIKDSVASNNTLNGYVVFPVMNGGAEMNIVDSTANNNKQFGIFAGAAGFTGTVRTMDTTVIHNSSQQLQINAGGSICTNQKNHIGNPTMAPNCTFVDQ